MTSALPVRSGRRLAARTVVFRAGDAADTPYEVVSGCVIVWSALPDGRRLIGQVALPGDAIGLACGDGHTTSAETVAETVLRPLPRDTDDPEHRLTAMLRQHVANLEAHALALARMTALERLARFLIRLAEHTGAPRRACVAIDLPLTRAEIADHLGLTIETVSRSLTKLRRSGLIRLERPDRAVIPDLAALAAAGRQS